MINSLFSFFYLVLYSELQDGLDTCLDVDCKVSSSGRVECLNPCTHNAFCDRSSSFYDWPFDSHKCKFHFTFLTNDVSKIKFSETSSSDKSKDFANNEPTHPCWRLASSTFKTSTKMLPFDKFQTAHSTIIMTLEVERANHQFIHQTVIPAIIISASNILYLCLDPLSYERVALFGINVLVNFLYIEQLRWMLPHDGQMPPLFLMFFLASQFITVVLMFLTIFIKYQLIDDGKQMEAWKLKVISDIEAFRLGKIFMENIFDNSDLSNLQKWGTIINRSTILVFIIIYLTMFWKLFQRFN